MTGDAATEENRPFRRVVRVAAEIAAPPERLWALLTNPADMPRWNSTVTQVDGRIAPGERLAIVVPITRRTFKVTVDIVEPPARLVWSAGSAVFRGVRTYTLTRTSAGGTRFVLEEVFTGIMLPLIALSLPDFKPVFERYAADLKQEAEGTGVK
jgi:uncharacterized protein YndB with AHSA1/START domain